MSQKLGSSTNRNFFIRPSTNQNIRRNQLNSQSQPQRKNNQNNLNNNNNDFVMFHIKGFGNLNNPNNKTSLKNTKRGNNIQNGLSVNEMQQKIQKIYGYEPPKTQQKSQNFQSQEKIVENNNDTQNKELKFYRQKLKIPVQKFENEQQENTDAQQQENINENNVENDVSEIQQQQSSEEDSMFDLQDLMVSGLDLGVSKVESTGITHRMKSQEQIDGNLQKKYNKYYFNQQLSPNNYNQQNSKFQNNFTQSVGGGDSIRKTLSLYQQKKKHNNIQMLKSQQFNNNKSKQMSQDMQKFNLKYQDFMKVVDNEYMSQFPNKNLQHNGSQQIQTQQSQQSSRFQNKQLITNKIPIQQNMRKTQKNSWSQKQKIGAGYINNNNINNKNEFGVFGGNFSENARKAGFKPQSYQKLNQNKQEQWKNNIQSQFRQHKYVDENGDNQINKGIIGGNKTQGNFFNNGSNIKAKKFMQQQQQMYRFE